MKTALDSNKRWTDSSLVVILLLLLLLAVARLELTHWADDLETAGWLLFLGAATGYLVGRTSWSSLRSSLWILILSIPTLLAVFLTNATTSGTVMDKFTQLWLRISLAVSQWTANQPVTDTILFLLGMGLLYWILGNAAGFSLVRSGRPWFSLLILGVAMLLMEHYQVRVNYSFYTFAYLVILFVLLGRLYYLCLRDELKAEDIKVGEGTGSDFTRGVAIAALAIGLASWEIPPFLQSMINPSQFPTPMTESWERFSKNFENLFYSLEEETPVKETDTGSTMNLGTGQLLGLNEVLAIETSQAFPFHNPFYWRQRSYDLYTNGQWSTGPARTITYHASEDLQKPSYKYLIPVDVKVTSKLAQLGTIYTPGLPAMLNKPVRVTYTLEGDSQADPTVLFVSPAVRYGETYRLNAVISAVTSEDLLIAGSDYPQWIIERYLQLPADLSPRVKALSLQLTASQQTPFEKAAAITEYLRTHITYQTTIAAPPAGRDVIDWFLFDYRKGFCNYYATAEVLMLRAAGVPARLSVGYAQGVQTDLNQTQFSVREKDRHAWPEVYFPGYGWIPFEPTTAISAVDYSGSGAGTAQSVTPGSGGILSGAASRAGLTGEDRALAILESQFSRESGLQVEPKLTLFGKVFIGAAVAAGLTALFFIARWLRRKWKDIALSFIGNQRRLVAFFAGIPFLGDAFLSIHLSRSERSFLTIERNLRLLGVRMPPGSTAYERTAALIAEIPEVEGDARALLAFYQTSVYGKSEGAPEKTGLATTRINLAVARVLLKRMIAPLSRQKAR